tara:strand:- start:306 stop:542 length:237 start_codon:yes stop_codon:yes gene_type:complete
MKTDITTHAKERMSKYKITKEMISDCLENPDVIKVSHTKRKIYNKKLNGYFLRVIVEESKEINRVITTYKPRSGRYGI